MARGAPKPKPKPKPRKKGSEVKVQKMKIGDLIPYDKNPRNNDEAVDAVMESIKLYGFRNPILVDQDHVIIAGHTRLWAARMLNMDHVPVIVIDDLDPEKVKELRLADNKTAELALWDPDLLGKELKEIMETGTESIPGFSDEEIDDLIQELEEDAGTEEAQPEIVFSEEILESNNYVVILFDNDVDWLNAQTHFGLTSVHSKRSNGKPWSKGIGRVINGGEYLDKFGGQK